MKDRLNSFINAGQEKLASEQEIRIARSNRAIRELDKINATIKPAQPLSQDDYRKATEIVDKFADIQEGFYNWETGVAQPWVEEKKLPKNIREKIGVDEKTGKQIVYWKDRWYEVR